MAQVVNQLLRRIGAPVYRSGQRLVRAPRFARELRRYAALADGGRFPLRTADLFPILTDYDEQAGEVAGHYFHQDLWAARKVFERRPASHLDIGSRLDGFVAHVLSFMPVTVVDIRPLDSTIPGLSFVRSDATMLAQFPDHSVESVSSLHAVEHFGLGRYGDPIDPEACFSAMRALSRVLAPGGRLYFSVPVGRERVQFNAHRVFAPTTVIESFGDLRLLSFAAIDDRWTFHPAADPSDFSAATYSCGLFEFTREG